MKSSQKIAIVLIILILIGGEIFWYISQRSEQKKPSYLDHLTYLPYKMKIESSAFLDNQFIPSKYTCDGENVNPPLKISGVPSETKSLVLIVDDPDAPRGTWVHWTLWNINPKITEISENNSPEGAVEGVTDFGKPGYGGPCPPSGTHRYFFKIYALDITLDLEVSAKVKDIEKAMEGHILDQARLIGLYSR